MELVSKKSICYLKGGLAISEDEIIPSHPDAQAKHMIIVTKKVSCDGGSGRKNSNFQNISVQNLFFCHPATLTFTHHTDIFNPNVTVV